MKAQMKFQKILSLVTILVAALIFIFALCYFTGNLATILQYHSDRLDQEYFVADNFINSAQSFVDLTITFVIILFVVIGISYIMGNNTRRNYYITNYISIGLLVFVLTAMSLYILISSVVLMSSFLNGIDWEGFELVRNDPSYNTIAVYQKEVTKSTTIFILGIVVALIVLANALAWVYNLIWKIKLMKGEKELLAQGFEKEVA